MFMPSLVGFKFQSTAEAVKGWNGSPLGCIKVDGLIFLILIPQMEYWSEYSGYKEHFIATFLPSVVFSVSKIDDTCQGVHLISYHCCNYMKHFQSFASILTIYNMDFSIASLHVCRCETTRGEPRVACFRVSSCSREKPTSWGFRCRDYAQETQRSRAQEGVPLLPVQQGLSEQQ